MWDAAVRRNRNELFVMAGVLYVLIGVVLSQAFVVNANHISDEFIARPNVGLTFERLDLKLVNAVGFYDIFYSMNLPDLSGINTEIKMTCYKNVSSYCKSFMSTMKQLKRLNDIFATLIKDKRDSLERLFEDSGIGNVNKFKKTRNRRALFSFIGDAMSELTGLAKQEDLSKLTEYVKLLAGQDQGNTHDLNELKSNIENILQVSDNRFNLSFGAIIQLQRSNKLIGSSIRKLANRLNSYSWNVLQFEENFMSAYLDILQRILHSDALLSHITSFYTGVEKLERNILASEVVSHKVIMDTCRIAEERLKAEHSELSLAFNKVKSFYLNEVVAVLKRGKQLHIHAEFPLISRFDGMNVLYRINSFDVSAGTDQYNVYTEIINAYRYIAVSLNEKRFLLLKEHDLNNCRKIDKYVVCRSKLVYASQESCIVGIFLNSTKSLGDCAFRIFKGIREKTLLYLGNGNYYVAAENETMSLASKHKRVRRVGVTNATMIVNLPCKYTISLGSLSMESGIEKCNYNLSLPVFYFQINFALLKQFKSEFYNYKLSHEKIAKGPVNLYLPNLNRAIDSFIDVRESDKLNGLILNKVVNAIKRKNKLYFDITNPGFWNKLGLEKLGGGKFYLVVYFAAHVLTILCILYILFKLHNLKLLMIGLLRGSDCYEFGTTPKLPILSDSLSRVEKHTVSIFLAIAVFVFIAFSCYKCCGGGFSYRQCCNRIALPEAHLYCRINWKGNFASTIKVGTVIGDVSKLTLVSLPKLVQIIEVGYMCRELKIVWSGSLMVNIDGRTRFVKLRDEVPLSWCLPLGWYRRLSMNNVEMVRLFVYTSDKSYPIATAVLEKSEFEPMDLEPRVAEMSCLSTRSQDNLDNVSEVPLPVSI